MLPYPVNSVAPIVMPSIIAGKPAINVNYIFSVEDYAFFFGGQLEFHSPLFHYKKTLYALPCIE